jgi:Sulfotransferase family
MIVFLHMPKTGGHSFKQVLFARFGVAAVGFVNGRDEYLALVRGWIPGRFAAVHGHMPLGLAHAIREACTYYVVLRDPVDRFVSDYYHLYNTVEHPLHRVIRGEGIGLGDYARRATPADPLFFNSQNAQVRRLATYDPAAVRDDGAYWWLTRPRADAAMLEEAKANLVEQIRHFGIFERLEASMQGFAGLLGATLHRVPRENVTPHRVGVDTLDAETVAAIREANRWDLELYAWARARFDAETGWAADAAAPRGASPQAWPSSPAIRSASSR